MKKDARIPGRVTAETKARWQAEASKLGYANLWSFIEDTVEEMHFKRLEEGEPSREVSAPPAPPPRSHPTGPTGPFDPTNPLSYNGPTGSAMTGPTVPVGRCLMEAKHRKGIYCKGCRTVIR